MIHFRNPHFCSYFRTLGIIFMQCSYHVRKFSGFGIRTSQNLVRYTWRYLVRVFLTCWKCEYSIKKQQSNYIINQVAFSFSRLSLMIKHMTVNKAVDCLENPNKNLLTYIKIYDVRDSDLIWAIIKMLYTNRQKYFEFVCYFCYSNVISIN